MARGMSSRSLMMWDNIFDSLIETEMICPSWLIPMIPPEVLWVEEAKNVEEEMRWEKRVFPEGMSRMKRKPILLIMNATPCFSEVCRRTGKSPVASLDMGRLLMTLLKWGEGVPDVTSNAKNFLVKKKKMIREDQRRSEMKEKEEEEE